jgi:hypothetical protein
MAFARKEFLHLLVDVGHHMDFRISNQIRICLDLGCNICVEWCHLCPGAVRLVNAMSSGERAQHGIDPSEAPIPVVIGAYPAKENKSGIHDAPEFN